ncbi:MAG: hypothetical protein ACMVY4_06505 [Minwuia sp.]|uniref:hypothetical protein n=1 Tax=Minwuia sp. TaxID=2493630 RepID=UPI003A8ACA18
MNGAAVREGDLRVTLTGAGTYRLPWRPAEFEPVAGYRFTHRMFFENDGFNQQNHQPFLSLSRRIGEDLSLSVRYDHTTSLSGNGLDLFVRQHGGSVTGLYRLASGDLLRGGYSLIWSNFNNVDDDDNLTNAVAMSWTRPDAGAPENAFTLGGRLALVSAEAQSSAHSAISIFAARETEIDGWFTLTAQVLAGRAQFNDDDPVDNIRRKDTTFSGSVVARRELGHNLFLNGNLSVTRVISTIDRIDRTSAVIGAGLRLNF